MKRTLVLSAILLGISCSVGPDIKDGMSFGTADGPGRKLTVTFNRGPEFLNIHWMAFMKMKVTPQIAVWMEDTAGAYLGTAFVTAGFGAQKWKYYSPKGDSCFRPMCMPCWFNRYLAEGNTAPTPGHPLPDAVTGATPTGSFTVSMNIPDSIGVFRLFAEWNRSFDNNDTFTKKRSSFNGQPSVVAGARIDLDDTTRIADTLRLLGRGGETGNDGKLYEDTGSLTTALLVFGEIVAEWEKAEQSESSPLPRVIEKGKE